MAKKHSSLGELIKKRRIERKISQLALGTALGFTSAQFISTVENRKALMPVKHLKALGKALDVKPSFLLALHMQDLFEKYLKQIQ